jgi:hypothetical protein
VDTGGSIGLLNLGRSGQAKRVTVPCPTQWVTHSTRLNDQFEVKVRRIVTARPMSLMGHFLPNAALLVMEGLPPIAERLASSAGFGSLQQNSFHGGWAKVVKFAGIKTE